MRTYAQIVDSAVYYIFDSETIPQFTDIVKIVDITDIEPPPKIGAVYANGNFTNPTEVVNRLPENKAESWKKRKASRIAKTDTAKAILYLAKGN